MITKVEDTKFTQKCVCGHLYAHTYSSVYIDKKFLALPICAECGSLEILHNNNKDDSHGLLVSKVFAKVATQE